MKPSMLLTGCAGLVVAIAAALGSRAMINHVRETRSIAAPVTASPSDGGIPKKADSDPENQTHGVPESASSVRWMLPREILDDLSTRARDWSYGDLDREWTTMDEFERRFILGAMVERDPEGGWAFLHGRNAAFLEVERLHALSRIAARDPHRAVALVSESGGAPEVVKRRLAALIDGWMHSDMSGAARFMAETRLPVHTSAYRTAAARMLKQDGPDAVVRWLDSFADQNSLEEAARAAGGMIAKASPRTAVEWLARHSDRAFAKDQISGPLTLFGTMDPAGAAAIVSAMPDSDTKWNSVMALSASWAITDVDSVRRWSETFQKAQYRDLALGEIANQQIELQPSEALNALAAITTPRLRLHYIDAVLRQGLLMAPDSLRSAILAGAPADIAEKFREITRNAAPNG